MSIRFVKAGLQTTLQDTGRPGYRRYGFPANGALDPVSLQIANWLVAKPLNAACLEVTLLGPTLEFVCDMAVAVAGANFDLFLNEVPVPFYQTLRVHAGDTLRFGKRHSGMRAYLAFSASLDVEPIMQSYSTHLMAGLGGYKGRAFQEGDVLPLKEVSLPPLRHSPSELHFGGVQNYRIRFIPGREYGYFKNDSLQYRVSSESDRMGVRLVGEPMKGCSPCSMQTIQVPPQGQPIITLADGQTTGGYPRYGHVITVDLAVLGQLCPQDRVVFQETDWASAKAYLVERQARLMWLLDK
jgi:antagonist of KipI